MTPEKPLIDLETTEREKIFDSGFIKATGLNDAIQSVLKDNGREGVKYRMLSPTIVIMLVIWMCFIRDKSIQAVYMHLMSAAEHMIFNAAHVKCPTSSAITQARQLLGADVFRALANVVLQPLSDINTIGVFYKGYEVTIADGVVLKLEDTKENREYFGAPSEGSENESSRPCARALIIAEAGTRAIIDARIAPFNTSEQYMIRQALAEKKLKSGMLIIFDRNFYSYSLAHELDKAGIKFIMRIRSNINPEEDKLLSDKSKLVNMYENEKDKNRSLNALKLRLVEYYNKYEMFTQADSRTKYRIFTNLMDHRKFPHKDIAELYRERWEVETLFDEIKTTLNCYTTEADFRSRKPELVIQEFYGLMIAHYLIKKLMSGAATENDMDPDVISFTGVINIIDRNTLYWAEKRDIIMYEELLNDMYAQIIRCRCKSSRGKKIKRGVKQWKRKFDIRGRDETILQNNPFEVEPAA